MSNVEINALLSQMRATASRLEKSLPEGSGAQEAAGTDFKSFMKDSVDQVNESQKVSTAMKESFVRGDPDTSLTEVMLQVQKADLSFRAMTEVRNKLVTAYQEIMNMPV